MIGGAGAAAPVNGVCTEVGNALLDVRKERFDFRWETSLHDLAYVIAAEDKLDR